jgi:hypothetical protein
MSGLLFRKIPGGFVGHCMGLRYSRLGVAWGEEELDLPLYGVKRSILGIAWREEKSNLALHGVRKI